MSFLRQNLKSMPFYLLFFCAIVTTVGIYTNLRLEDMASFVKKKDPHIVYDPTHSLYAIYEHNIETGMIGQITSSLSALEDSLNLEKYPSYEVTATGYTAGVESTGKDESHPSYGITYSGVHVIRDLYSTVAADISVFPIGTILWIPDYGLGVVADIGGAIKGHHIDLYYDTVSQVYEEWGKKTLKIYVIEEGKGKLTEEQLKKLNDNKSLQTFRVNFRKKQKVYQ